MSRGALHYLLTNPAYRGTTRHHEKRYENTHPAIIDVALWDKVQARLENANPSQPKTERRGEGALLDGLLFDDLGHDMIPVHTKRGATRYRYYVSRASHTRSGQAGSLHRISAGVMERFLVERLESTLSAGWQPSDDPARRVALAIQRITLSSDQLVAAMHRDALRHDAATGVEDDEPGLVTLRLPFHMHRRQGALILEPAGAAATPAAKVDRALVRAVVLARRWGTELESGAVASVTALADREGLCKHYTARMLPLAYLAPDLVEQILSGRQPRALTLGALTAAPLPSDWVRQRALFQRAGAI
jgi:hypothetical protein